MGEYIRRGGRGVESSKWANPFRIGPDGDREEVLEKYEGHLRSTGLKKEIGELEERTLLCHCGIHQRCHGDILLKILEEEGRDIG